MEAVVLAAVLGFSVVIAVASAFGSLALAMYLIDVASGATARVGRTPTPASESWLTELSLRERPAAQRSLAA